MDVSHELTIVSEFGVFLIDGTVLRVYVIIIYIFCRE